MNHAIQTLLLTSDDAAPAIPPEVRILVMTRKKLEEIESSEEAQRRIQGWKWKVLWTTDAVEWMMKNTEKP